MWTKVDLPCVGGPVDGRSLLVDIDEAGVRPETIDENWLWVEFGGELLEVDVDGGYELEPVAGARPAMDLPLGRRQARMLLPAMPTTR